MTGSTISSTSAAITAPPPSTEPPGPRPFRTGPRSPAWPLGHKPSCDRPSCALSRPEPIKLTVPEQLPYRGRSRHGQGAFGGLAMRMVLAALLAGSLGASHLALAQTQTTPAPSTAPSTAPTPATPSSG